MNKRITVLVLILIIALIPVFGGAQKVDIALLGVPEVHGARLFTDLQDMHQLLPGALMIDVLDGHADKEELLIRVT